MPYLISILLASLLFFGFLLLTWYESRRGTRFFPSSRYRLDAKVARLAFLIDHVDWGAFTAHLTKTSLNTIAHDLAHGTLIAVRAVERFLTRAVYALRRRKEAGVLPSATARLENRVTHLRERARQLRASDILRRQPED